jgi:L-lactate utilization protein LutB
MKNPVENYRRVRLEGLRESLEANNFEVYMADNAAEARRIVLERILPAIDAKSVSWGGSMTLGATGLMNDFLQMDAMAVINPYEKDLSDAQKLERRRQALLVDLYLTGCNAMTEDGRLVNLDMIGNRVAALTFGPRAVVVLVGANKLVANLDDAMWRVKEFAAPANAMRLDMKTPCAKTSVCEECKSPQRICNTWTITEKSFPRGRVKVVLINQVLGL